MDNTSENERQSRISHEKLYDFQVEFHGRRPVFMLENFHLFSDLPTELRLKIWGYYLETPRIVEVQPGNDWNIYESRRYRGNLERGEEALDGTNSDQPRRSIEARSRRAPAILHVNKEARAEGLRVHELHTLDSRFPEDTKAKFYFNPLVDILYFSGNNTLATMIRVFKRTSLKAIPRVAINLSFVADRRNPSNDKQDQYSEAEIFRALHGIDDDILIQQNKYAERWTGCPGLKEVFFFARSRLWAGKGVDMLDVALGGIRPATAVTSIIERMQGLDHIEQIIRVRKNESILEPYGGWRELMRPYQGLSRWLGANKPEFHLVSFAPLEGINGIYYDGLAIKHRDEQQFFSGVANGQHRVYSLSMDEIQAIGNNIRSSKYCTALKKIAEATGCNIVVAPIFYATGDGEWELGFSGSRSAIKEAKALVLKDIIGSGDEVRVVQVGSDPGWLFDDPYTTIN